MHNLGLLLKDQDPAAARPAERAADTGFTAP